MAGRADKDMAKDVAILEEKAARKKERRKHISEKIVEQKLERLQQLMTEDGDVEDTTIFDKIRRGQVDEEEGEEQGDEGGEWMTACYYWCLYPSRRLEVWEFDAPLFFIFS